MPRAALGPRTKRNLGQQGTAQDNEPEGERPVRSDVLGGETSGARFHTAEASRHVSRLSAVIPHAASRRTTAPCPAAFLSRSDVVPFEAAEGLVRRCGWHDMQGVSCPAVCAAPTVADMPSYAQKASKSCWS